MAAEKTTKRRRKTTEPDETRSDDTRADEARGEKTPKRADKPREKGSGTALRLITDPRKERRYEPKASTTAVVSILGLSVGAVALGAGLYGQWMWQGDAAAPAHAFAPWILLAGALVLIAIAFFGPRGARPIRVGDAGVGTEKDGGEVERLEWRDVNRVTLSGSALVLEGNGSTVSVPRDLHGPAVARILAEARRRIASKLEDIEDGAFRKPDDAEGEVIPLEEPQLAGARCKASDKLIAFEKDVRLCGKCGEVYHKDHVPAACLTCEAKLK